jgi:hypothetical protein
MGKALSTEDKFERVEKASSSTLGALHLKWGDATCL